MPCFRGLKLHPNIQCFYADDQRLYPLYQWLEEHHYPALFHTGGIGLNGIRDCYGAPERIDTIACDFPDLPIIMGHCREDPLRDHCYGSCGSTLMCTPISAPILAGLRDRNGGSFLT